MRALAKINLDNLKKNYLTIKKKTKKEIIAVLKDNAYGHDLIHSAQVLSSLGVRMIAVATFEEAVTLRKNLIFTPILLFERCSSYRLLSSYRITSSIQSLEHLKELAASNFPLSIHLEIDTGFHRFGIQEEELDNALNLIAHSALVLKGVYTHFGDESSYEEQNQIFHRVLDKIPFRSRILIHSASSRFLEKEDSYTNTVRPGISLYGFHTSLKLLPVLSLYARVLRCSPIKKGEWVSYDKEICEEDGYILTLGIGYGDGWKRSYNTIAYADKYYTQIGVTNMDSLMLFAKNPLPPLTSVELLGSHLTLKDLLEIYDVTPYEFYSSLSYRITKEYLKSN